MPSEYVESAAYSGCSARIATGGHVLRISPPWAGKCPARCTGYGMVAHAVQNTSGISSEAMARFTCWFHAASSRTSNHAYAGDLLNFVPQPHLLRAVVEAPGGCRAESKVFLVVRVRDQRIVSDAAPGSGPAQGIRPANGKQFFHTGCSSLIGHSGSSIRKRSAFQRTDHHAFGEVFLQEGVNGHHRHHESTMTQYLICCASLSRVEIVSGSSAGRRSQRPASAGSSAQSAGASLRSRAGKSSRRNRRSAVGTEKQRHDCQNGAGQGDDDAEVKSEIVAAVDAGRLVHFLGDGAGKERPQTIML